MRIRNVVARGVLVAMGWVGVATSAHAAPFLFESATLGTTGAMGGASISYSQFLGVRFDVTEAITTSSVAGHLGGRGTAFAALVALTSTGDIPDTMDLSSPDVVGTAVFTLPGDQTAAVIVPFVVDLLPGRYGLIFGTGLFGATGYAYMAGNGELIGTPSFFVGGGTGSPFFDPGSATPFRFAVEGESTSVSTVPEPTSLMLLGTGALGLILKVRRRAPRA